MTKIQISKHILLVFIVFLGGCGVNSNGVSLEEYLVVEIGGVEVLAEVADDSFEQSRGLMNRDELGELNGMWFEYSSESVLTFWMKDTLIGLDIIFISSDFEIVNIVTAKPCEVDPCEHYSSALPASYVLEVNSGFSEEHGVVVGDFVIRRGDS